MTWRFSRLRVCPGGSLPLTVVVPPTRYYIRARYQSTSNKPVPEHPKHKDISSSPKSHSNPSSKKEGPSSTDTVDTSLGRLITDDFSALQLSYTPPKHPIILAHGLMGFDELRLFGQHFPSIHYWRGITSAFRAHGIEAYTTAVPTTGSIAQRAEVLYHEIAHKTPGRSVNIIAHSMGGLDARYMISQLLPRAASSSSSSSPPPPPFTVHSLTTIATPHRGSSVADMLIRDIGPAVLPRIYRILDRLNLDSGAFSQLTTTYMNDTFNPAVPDSPDVSYFSYAASATPSLFSVFRVPHDLLLELEHEGPNDGLVSVRSAKWGEFRGTLVGVTHLDLINWTNRLKRMAARAGLVREKFNAVAFYLSVAEELGKEGF